MTVVVTRAKEQASGFAKLLQSLGIRVLSAPAIKIVPPPSYKALDQAVRNLSAYDWLIFTSANGVEHFKRRLGSTRIPKSLKTCALGPATAREMRRRKIPVTKISKDFVAESILKTLPPVNGKKILVPQAAKARDVLRIGLKKMGASVDAVPAYQTVPDPAGARKLRNWLASGRADCVAFTSSSTVENFLRAVPRVPKGTLAASIGPITTRTLLRRNWKPAIVAKKSTTAHLARAIADYFKKGKP